MARKICKGKCVKLPEYDSRKKIAYGYHHGYIKCTVCECFFYQISYCNCKCCGNRFKRSAHKNKSNRITNQIKYPVIYPVLQVPITLLHN